MEANKVTKFDLHRHYVAVRRRMNANAVSVTELLQAVERPKEDPKPVPIRVDAHRIHIPSPSVREVVFIVGRMMNVSPWDIISKRRTAHVINARHMAIYVTKEVTNFSYPQIGKAFGGLDHSTCIHAVRRMQEMVATMPEIRAIAEAAITEFNDDEA